MLSFNSGLTNRYLLKNSYPFWVLKLYYNDESDSIGVSDRHRVDGSDTYYGLVSDWGTFSHSLSFFTFTASISSLTIKLINTLNSFQGGRFSDQLSAKNFANRKWELFQCVNGVTLDTAANQIGSGIISGGGEYNRNEITFTLLDNTSRYHKEIPITKVLSSVFANAPEKNYGKPLPISYGDFDVDSNSPTSGARFDRHVTNGKFPAIVVDEWHKTDARMEARLDNSTIHTLNTNRAYLYNDSIYSACDSGNVSINASAGSGQEQISVKGNEWYAYIRLKKHATYDAGNYANEIDNDFTTSETLTTTHGDTASEGWRIPKIPKLGSFTSISILLDLGSYTKPGGASNPTLHVSNNVGGKDISATWDPNPDEQTVDISGLFSTAQEDNWDFESDVFLELTGAAESGTYSVAINEVALEVKYIPDVLKFHSKEVRHFVTHDEKVRSDKRYGGEMITVQRTRYKKEKLEGFQPLTDYIYASGKGRKYGSWISDNSRSVGYSTSDFIANPVFIIEDILRTELGLSDTQISVTDFNTSGNTTNGEIGDGFDDAVADVKFAFSQDTFSDSKSIIESLCAHSCSWVWISGDGKFKIKSRRQPNDYVADDENDTIDYRDITLDMIRLTPLNEVRNSFTINYAYDYGEQQNTKQKTASDSTSKGTAVGGYNETLDLEIDAFTIQDSTTAQQLANSYKSFQKDRWTTIMFDVPSAKYNHLEIGDIINFSNWDDKIKIFGTSMASTNFFIITETNKRPNGCEFFCTEVSD